MLIDSLDKNDILCGDQHVFRLGRSCLTQMLSHFDEIMLGLLEDKDTDSIYLDYAKAFDKVDHDLLIKKLERYGLPPIITKWITSFLRDRSQTVIVNGYHSIADSIIRGVPQATGYSPWPNTLYHIHQRHAPVYKRINCTPVC